MNDQSFLPVLAEREPRANATPAGWMLKTIHDIVAKLPENGVEYFGWNRRGIIRHRRIWRGRGAVSGGFSSDL